jgi:hypothetical protein
MYTMAFDLTGVFDAITVGLSKIPAGLLAAALLAGPTAIWIIVRFSNPPIAQKEEESVREDSFWVCGSCRSLNEDRRASCYSCHRSRTADSPPVFDGAAAALGASGNGRGVGIAVGPGRPMGDPAYPWLGAELTGAHRPTEDMTEPEFSDDDEPEAADAPAADDAIAASESPTDFEPMILEPWVKVSSRPAAPIKARRD